MQSSRWKVRPPGSNWGDFGPDDQRGRLNLVTPKKVLEGIAEAREGVTFCVSMPLDYPGGNYRDLRRLPPRLQPLIREGRIKYHLRPRPDHTDVYNDDFVVLYTQYSTQWDGLAHVGSVFDADGDGEAEIVYYNGYRAGEHVIAPASAEAAAEGFRGATKLGIENMATACVQGRGVMIDLFAHFGRPRKIVGYDDLMRVLEADRVEVEKGDMVCLHTGQADAIVAMGKSPDKETLENAFSHLDGCDERLLRWVDDSGLAVLLADNFAVEASPSRDPQKSKAFEPLHELCLFKLGIHLGELFHFGPLSEWLRAHGRYRFLLTAPPLRLPGAVGSPTTAVATV